MQTKIGPYDITIHVDPAMDPYTAIVLNKRPDGTYEKVVIRQVRAGVINGIDFDRRLDETKEFLHAIIEMMPYYQSCLIIKETPEGLARMEKFKESMRGGFMQAPLRTGGIDPKKVAEKYKEWLEKGMSNWPPFFKI